MTQIPPSSNTWSHRMKRSNAGFTLLELMIVVAIVAILAVVAVASYDFAVIKTRRAAAAGCALELAQQMERHYTANLTYVGAPAPAGGCVNEQASFYTFTNDTPAATATTFTIVATPQGSQSKDTKCGTLGINQVGAKTASGTSSAHPEECW